MRESPLVPFLRESKSKDDPGIDAALPGSSLTPWPHRMPRSTGVERMGEFQPFRLVTQLYACCSDERVGHAHFQTGMDPARM